ncbi:unnamed protein product, partial [Mesorhabditis belari]|uniref:Serpentine receptor class gamma n=1 Tax=Mesorhabditis belari TaxID=2138241 RepID=A0AAF3FIA4_9BILA
MHLNRFTAVLFPFIHHKLWKPVHFRLAAISIFLIGFAFNFENFFVTGYYAISAAGVAVNPINRSLQVPISFWAEKTMGHVYPTVSVLINVTILTKLLHMRASGKNFSGQKSIEINLLMICLASLFCQLALMCFVDFAPSLFNQEIWFLTLNFVSDFSTLSEAWIGLTVNGVLRKRFIQWLRPSFSSSPIIFAEVSSNFLLREQIPRRLKPINTT